MKFIAAVCVLFALLGIAFGLKDPVCGLPPKSDGNGLIKCAAFMPSFSFDAASNSCQSFVYGGCGGNDNRFPSQESCEQKCKE
ncbi:male accessory gland serine protease inhibitor-like [Drosophila ficusphila]|uniref:male accessory gland serine protease inhibitor-like n=1 Tax=Drosophila ficusphila TaxID=30025 RepID=UPI0007E85574|nr:male accessory gland serine protease inhibitor-like [Drosophila ficusphila]